jgi:hypothetical protein
MAFTFQHYYQHVQRMMKDTSAGTLDYIKRMVNAAYKSLLALLPTYWTEHAGTFAVPLNATVANLDPDCFKVISVDYPVNATHTIKPVIVTQEDWAEMRLPPDAFDLPVIFYPAGYYQTMTAARQLQLMFYPGCSNPYTGSYRYRYYSLPNDMTIDAETPVFDDRWQQLLLSKCHVEMLYYEGKYPEAQALEQNVQAQIQAYMGRESKGKGDATK